MSSAMRPVSGGDSLVVSYIYTSPLTPRTSYVTANVSDPFTYYKDPVSFGVSRVPVAYTPVLSFDYFVRIKRPTVVVKSPDLTDSYFDYSFAFSIVS